jgi:hypothetical protein
MSEKSSVYEIGATLIIIPYQPIHGILARETNDLFVGSKGEHSTHTEGTTAVLLASRVFSTFVACCGA